MKQLENPQLAYENLEFLNSDSARPIRLMAEYMRPAKVMKEHHVKSTVVVFGSARIKPLEDIEAEVATLEEQLKADPKNKKLAQSIKRSEYLKKYCKYYDMARDFSRIVSESANRGEHDVHVVTGGGPGIMEAGNRGAHDAGCPSVALNIKLPFEQCPNPYVTEKLCFNFHYFSIRKMHFLSRARALCAFPGGFGTMDELFETLTLIQTEKVDKMPVVIFGKEFWDELVNWEKFVEAGLISPEDLELFHFSDDPEEAWEYITNYWKEKGSSTCPKYI